MKTDLLKSINAKVNQQINSQTYGEISKIQLLSKKSYSWLKSRKNEKVNSNVSAYNPKYKNKLAWYPIPVLSNKEGWGRKIINLKLPWSAQKDNASKKDKISNYFVNINKLMNKWERNRNTSEARILKDL